MAGRFFEYVKSVLRKPKASIFLMFLIISFFIWFLISLSDTHTSHVSFRLNYNGIPKDRLILGKPRTSLTTNIETSGFKILNYRIFKRDVFLNLTDFKKKGSKYYMLPDAIKEAIRVQCKSINIRRVGVDSLILNLGVNQKKYVKVISKIQMSYAEDYQLRDSLKIIPDSVWVRGPEDVVNKITRIETENLEYVNVRNNFNYTVPLNPSKSIKNIEYQTDKVLVKGVVERYSEKIILVPIEVENLPESISLKIYPEKIKLLCKAPVSELKHINENAFKVVCNYNEISDETTYLIPQLIEQPKFLSSVKILDRKVEFLIKKQ